MSSAKKAALQQRKRAIVLLVIVAAVAAALTADPVHEALDRALEAARGVIVRYPRAGIAMFILLSALSAMVVFFSTAVIVPVAIYSWGRPTTLALLWTGWLIGGIATYFIGRFPGRRFFAWLMPSRARDYQQKISEKASFPLVLLFQMAVPSEIPGYVLGAARYDVRRYLLALGLAELPYAIGAVYLGEGFVRRNFPLLIGVAVAGILLSTLAFHFLHKQLEKR